jgi:uncharacterized membrane protein YccC
MDWPRGLRAATALSTPLLLADFTSLTHLGWSALGGIEAIVSDAGGPYRSRLGRLSVLSIGGALAVFLGTLVGGDLRWALPVTLLFCFVWTYLSVLGQPFASAGLLVQVIYICGIGDPDPSLREALLRAGFLLLGGLWATLLSLFLWPLDPYRPARSAVAGCYRALADFLATIRRMQSEAPIAADWHRPNLQHKGELRRLIERAWDAIASVRAESQAETAQGRHLIVLLESADLILGFTVSLAEHTEAVEPSQSHDPCTGIGPFASLELLQEAEQSVAAQLVRRSPIRAQAAEALRESLAQLSTSLPACFSPEDADGRFLSQQIAEIASNLETAAETVSSLRLGIHPQTTAGAETPALQAARQTRAWSLQSTWERLAANWCRSSLLLRHAARVALVCGFDVCLIEKRHFGHGYWLMMTSLIVLQPHVSGTLRRGLQRIGGTVGGGILAALLAIVLHSQLVTGIVLFPLALLALALLPVNYAAFAFFLTPTFVLAFLRHTGDWQLAFLRIGNTIAGAAISIAAMTVLFPSYERERIAGYLRASLQANRFYLEQLTDSWTRHDPGTRTLALARRATGLAHNDMEESLERVLAEAWARKASSENLLAFAAYLHRVSQTITGLATLANAWDWKQSRLVQNRLASIHSQLKRLEEVLDPAAASAQEHQCLLSDLQAEPSLDSSSASPGPRQIARLERQVQVMRRHLEALKVESWLLRP